jgi:hypothetical protein
MTAQRGKPGFHEGTNYSSPVTRVLALGYYDGPTNGVLQCGEGGPVYKFDLLAGPFSTEDGLGDLRVFGLAPLPPQALDQLADAYQRYGPARWPLWVPIWHFPTAADEEAMNRLTDQMLLKAGSTEWVLATFDLMGEIRAARAITGEELVRVTDWLAFLGVGNESVVKRC